MGVVYAVNILFFLQNSADVMVLHHVARILELVIPLMDNPRECFLAQVSHMLC